MNRQPQTRRANEATNKHADGTTPAATPAASATHAAASRPDSAAAAATLAARAKAYPSADVSGQWTRGTPFNPPPAFVPRSATQSEIGVEAWMRWAALDRRCTAPSPPRPLTSNVFVCRAVQIIQAAAATFSSARAARPSHCCGGGGCNGCTCTVRRCFGRRHCPRRVEHSQRAKARADSACSWRGWHESKPRPLARVRSGRSAPRPGRVSARRSNTGTAARTVGAPHRNAAACESWP